MQRRPPRERGNAARTTTTHKGDEEMARVFVYDDREFPDPEMSVD